MEKVIALFECGKWEKRIPYKSMLQNFADTINKLFSPLIEARIYQIKRKDRRGLYMIIREGQEVLKHLPLPPMEFIVNFTVKLELANGKSVMYEKTNSCMI